MKTFLFTSFICLASLAACGGSDDDVQPGASPGAAGAGGGSAGKAQAGAGGGSAGKAQAGAGGAMAGSAGKAQAGSGGADAGKGGSAGAPGGSAGAPGGSAGAPGGSGGASGGGAGAPGGSGGASGGSAGAPGGSGGASGGASPGDTPTCSPATGPTPKLKLTPLITQGLGKPVLVTHAPGDTSRLYIVQQGGTVRIAQNGKLTGVFADLGPKLTSGGERGLLGLAFHPQFAQNGRVFVHYSSKASANPGTQDGDTVIAELTATPDVGDVSSLKTLMTVKQPQANHNGGSIEFSPVDGFLYIALGDGGGGGDDDNHGPIGNGQNLATMLGKLLRVDVSTVGTLSVPASNPKLAGANPEIWAYGLRNPYRVSFDMCTGDRYIADVGQGEHEEIDVEASASPGGLNYGWRIMEGTSCYNPSSNCDQTGLTLPVTTYDHDQGNCSVSGGYVYRGAAIPGLRGRYFYGDYCSGRVWSFAYAGGVATDPIEHTAEFKSDGMPISGFGQDASGEVYVVAYGGTVYRIDAL